MKLGDFLDWPIGGKAVVFWTLVSLIVGLVLAWKGGCMQ